MMCAKILLMPLQMVSLVQNFHWIGQELAHRGHDVYSALSDQYVENAKAKIPSEITVITYRIPDSDTSFVSENTATVLYGAIKWKTTWWQFVLAFGPGVFQNCKDIMLDETFLSKITHIEFDMILVDGSLIQPCLLVIPAYLKVPFVLITPEVMPDHHRILHLPSFAGNFYNEYSGEITFLGRLHNTFLYFLYAIMFPIPVYNDTLLEEYGQSEFKDMTWTQMLRQTELIICIRDHILDSPEPTMPHLVLISGIVDKPKPLANAIEKIMNASTEYGVIVMSFGSMLDRLPDDIQDRFMLAFKQINQTVVWRVVVEDVSTVLPDNVHIMDWLPQSDLLRHPNTKLFITHCGNGGKYDAVTHGIPMIGFPHFFDQHRNAQRMVKRGLGISMDILDFTLEDLLLNIKEMFGNPIYMENAKHRAAILADQPMTSPETAAYWIEHVITFGGGHLRSHGLDMPWYEYYMFDILCILFITCTLFVLTILTFVRVIIKLCQKKIKQE
jgi:glucuronosyltransferase